MSGVPIKLERVWLNELNSKAWVRSWRGSELPEWFRHGLEAAKPCLGHGVVDPLELRLDGSNMTLISHGEGQTLLEYLRSAFKPKDENYVRLLIEELCYGLARIHDAQKKVHGGINPFNVSVCHQYILNFWALPTARLELTGGKMDKYWEAAYRSPQVLTGQSPGASDDIYSLGILFARLLNGNHKNFVSWLDEPEFTLDASSESKEILDRCLAEEPDQRFQSARELALALNPESKLAELDIIGAEKSSLLGIEAFQEGQLERAEEHFLEARKLDWLSLKHLNNFGVAQMALENWDEAYTTLNRAFKMESHHPMLDINMAHLQLKKEDHSLARDLATRATQLNPYFHQAHRLLARLAQEKGQIETAIESAHRALNTEPKCSETRLLLAELARDPREISLLKQKAKKTPPPVPLFDHLITETTRPPWTLYLNGERSSLLRRFEQAPGYFDRYQIRKRLSD